MSRGRLVLAYGAACSFAALAACGPRMARPPELPPLPAPTDSGLAAVPVPPEPPSTWVEKQEMRAGWVVAWRQMTSTAAIDQAMSWAEAAGLNTLFVQVRASGDAYYKSDLAPRAEALAGQAQDFDPLAYALKKGRAKGFKIHAWLNTGLIWRSTTPPVAAQHVFNAHPEWILTDATGKLAWPDPATDPKPGYVEEHYWVNWGHPGLQEHLAAVAGEVNERYDVDGIHLDFLRFPARMGPRTPGVGYDEVSVARFKEATGGLEPREHERAWDEWRADQITAVVNGIYWAVKGLKPRVEVSAAALGAWNLASGRNFTSYRRWLHEGILDFAVPMSYFKDPSWIWQSALGSAETSDPRRVVLGLFLPYHTSAALAEQIRLVREFGLRGWSLFSLDTVDVPGIDGYAPEVKRAAYTDPTDDRYVVREPLWNRVGVVDEKRKAWTLRFYSRSGNSKLVVYPRGVTKFKAKINGRPLPELPARDSLVQADVTAYLEPHTREVAANHDFTLSVEADGDPGFYAQVFVVDYYARP